MDEKDLAKFCVTLLQADYYFSWSNDTEIVLSGKGLWKYLQQGEEERIKEPILVDMTFRVHQLACQTARRVMGMRKAGFGIGMHPDVDQRLV